MQKIQQRLRRWFAEQGFYGLRIVTHGSLHCYSSGEAFPCRLIVFNSRNEPLLVAPEPLERAVPETFRKEYPDLCWILCNKKGALLIRELDSGMELPLPGRGAVRQKGVSSVLWVLLAFTGAALLLWRILS